MASPRICSRDDSISGPDLFSHVTSVAHALFSLNFSAGSSIGIYADLSLSGLLLTMASIRLGLKTALCPLREPNAVIEAWLKELGITSLVSSVKGAPDLVAPTRCYFLNDLMVNRATSEALPDSGGDFFSINRTSGTSAKPKSAFISGIAHLASAKAVNDFFSFHAQDMWALSLPFSHVSGLSIVFRALQSGGGIYLIRDYHELLQAIRSDQLSHCSLVPAQVKRLLAENVSLSHLKAVVVGGDTLMPALRDQALARSWPLYECYGLTETASMIAVSKSSSPASRLEILPHARMILSNEEIFVSGQSLFSGYWEGGQLRLPLSNEGFFPTGDIYGGKDFNQLHIIRRKNNRIVSGGENIQAEEIEAVLEEHPAISSAVVLGIPDEQWGERPIAYIRWHKEPIAPVEILSFLEAKLARFKWPDRFLTWPADLEGSLKKPRRLLLDHYQQNI